MVKVVRSSDPTSCHFLLNLDHQPQLVKKSYSGDFP